MVLHILGYDRCMKRIALITSCVILTLAAAAKAEEPRTAGAGVYETVRSGFCYLDRSYKNGAHYLDSREPLNFEQPVQWENTRWDPAVWQEEYGTYWNADKVLAGLFKGNYFTAQFMHCKTPYVKIGLPFFDLGEADRLRALRLLAEQTGVLEKHRSFKIYSPDHGKVIGTYSNAGLTLY